MTPTGFNQHESGDAMSDTDPRDAWTPEAFCIVLRRQIAELQEAKADMQAAGENPDDNARLLDVVVEIRAFRGMLEEMEGILKRKTQGDEGKTP